VCLLESLNGPLQGYQAFPFIDQGKGLEYMGKIEKKEKKKQKNKIEGKEF
jgi:hypothetical protein